MPVYSNFSDWENLNYSPLKKKIGGFAPAWDKSFFGLTGYQDDIIIRDLATELYQMIRTNEIPIIRPDRIPFVSFSHNSTQAALDAGFPDSLVINHPKYANGTRKIDMHKKFSDKDYVPKTAFSQEDAIQNLKFPIIAKASESQGAKGVYQYKTPQELIDAKIEKIKDPKEKPDLFCEKIEIIHEYRLVVYVYQDGTQYLMYLAERIPSGDKIKGLREQDVSFLKTHDPPGNFSWELLNPETETVSKNAKIIIEDCIKANPGVQILAIDFCVDDQNKWWYIECNMHPGMSYYLPISIYFHAYQDYYGQTINKEYDTFYLYLMDLAIKYTTYTNAIIPPYKIPDFPPNIPGKLIT
jgi:hypothetical protein